MTTLQNKLQGWPLPFICVVHMLQHGSTEHPLDFNNQQYLVNLIHQVLSFEICTSHRLNVSIVMVGFLFLFPETNLTVTVDFTPTSSWNTSTDLDKGKWHKKRTPEGQETRL